MAKCFFDNLHIQPGIFASITENHTEISWLRLINCRTIPFERDFFSWKNSKDGSRLGLDIS